MTNALSTDTPPAQPLPRWDADARSRTQTRALLMALSRERDWYFVMPLWRTLIVGVLTLGLWPLWESARRFERWRRLEWVQYAEFGRWVERFVNLPRGAKLVEWTDGYLESPEPRVTSSRWLVVTTWVVLVIGFVILNHPRSGFNFEMTGNRSVDLAAHGVFALLAGRAFGQIVAIQRHAWLARYWLGEVTDLMRAEGRRAINAPVGKASHSGWSRAAAALLGIQVFVAWPVWLLIVPTVIAVQNEYVASTRAVRLQLIERLLEWMDDSGLPVEFDVEALEPEEIAAMLA